MKKLFFLSCFIPVIIQARWPFDIFEPQRPFVLILEATGDAVTPGRTIFNNFENSVSYTLARQIKEQLDALYFRTKIMLNRTPTEILAPFQNAQFANKLNADLYLSIHCYQQNHGQPTITLYQYSYREPSVVKKDSLGFYAYDQIYLCNESQTNNWAQELKKLLTEQNLIDARGPYKLPFKPLMGINASALSIEIGVTADTNLEHIMQILSHAIQQFILKSNP